LGFPTKSQYMPLLSLIHATCPAHRILLDFITHTILGEKYRSFSSSLCSFLHSPVTPCLLRPNILRSTLSQTPSACIPPSMSATRMQKKVLSILNKSKKMD
jgi:hypothetical protein